MNGIIQRKDSAFPLKGIVSNISTPEQKDRVARNNKKWRRARSKNVPVNLLPSNECTCLGANAVIKTSVCAHYLNRMNRGMSHRSSLVSADRAMRLHLGRLFLQEKHFVFFAPRLFAHGCPNIGDFEWDGNFTLDIAFTFG
ncbi:hypothetical protein JTE90_016798 [Oedothorax gibbosus]|uniref:Uncharacterized protein n=1 Tax=Oedothorax gibbosus TaxID=931172 RepID=A0AAV6VYX0_9ARAC|nr:hypothetical protein JTE90_016798 [Oedothorax gibbosus]